MQEVKSVTACALAPWQRRGSAGGPGGLCAADGPKETTTHTTLDRRTSRVVAATTMQCISGKNLCETLLDRCFEKMHALLRAVA